MEEQKDEMRRRQESFKAARQKVPRKKIAQPEVYFAPSMQKSAWFKTAMNHNNA